MRKIWNRQSHREKMQRENITWLHDQESLGGKGDPPKLTTFWGKTKMASKEIDPRPHKYWPSVEPLKAYGQKTYRWYYYLSTLPRPFIPFTETSIRPIKRNRNSKYVSLQKHQSESTFTGWRHRILRHCSKSTTRGHACPIPLYHLSRLRA